MRSVYSNTLAVDHEESRHYHSQEGEDPNKNERVLDTHSADPAGECKLDNHCEAVADKDHGDKGVIEDLNLLLWSRIPSADLEWTYQGITIC